MAFIAFISCKSTETQFAKDEISKTLLVEVLNKSDFDVEIIENNPDSIYSVAKVEKNKSCVIEKNLFVYDEISYFFYPRFLIPIGDIVIPITEYNGYRIETKNGLNQKIEIQLTNDNLKNLPYYTVLKNNSNKEVLVMNSSSKNPYVTEKNVKSIVSGGMGVYSSSDREFYFNKNISMLIEQSGKHCDFPFYKPYSGFVYTYSFDGKNVVFEDARPIIKTNEPLWSKDYSDTVLLKTFCSKNENVLFCIGNKVEEDKNKNKFWSVYFGCFENTGAKKWEAGFLEKDADNKIFDGILLENKLICIGQNTNGNSESGLVIVVDSTNGHVETFKISEVSGLFSVNSCLDDSIFAAGFDRTGSLVLLEISFENSRPFLSVVPLELPRMESKLVYHALCFCDSVSEKIILLCNRQNEIGEILSSVLYQFDYDGKLISKEDFEESIKSVSCMIRRKNREIFVSAETFGNENTSAVVIKVLPDGQWSYFYRNENPSSFITNLCLSENEDFVVVSGVQDAIDSYGCGGNSFFAGLDSDSAEKLWFTEYEKKENDLLTNFSVVPEYGFVGIFCHADESGIVESPSSLKRMTLNGKFIGM